MTGPDMAGRDVTAPRMRAGTIDRQNAVDRLTRHFTDGRLQPDEFDERMGTAYNATYLDEFPALFIDLPEDDRPAFGPFGDSPERYRLGYTADGRQDRPARPFGPPRGGPPRGGPPRGLIVVAVVAALFWVGVLTHALFLFPLIWLAFALSVGGRRRRHWQRYDHGRRPGPWDRPEHWQHR